MSRLKVAVVEDSQEVRERLIASLANTGHVELVGEYDDAKSAIKAIDIHRPEVVLLDIKLRGSSGLEVMRYLHENKSPAKVIVLTNYAEQQYRELFLRLGAIAVLDKSHEFDRVPQLLSNLANFG